MVDNDSNNTFVLHSTCYTGFTYVTFVCRGTKIAEIGKYSEMVIHNTNKFLV